MIGWRETVKFKDNIPKKYQSKIVNIGYLGKSSEHKSRLEINFENDMKLTIYDISEQTYQEMNSCKYGWEYYFSENIYPNYRDQIEMVKN
ncbi:hypothetical protein EWP19_17140 [Acinetobacter piscicola]|nr:hypothetical protein EWP19_17140 [Acinetobacter piscicola]